MILKLTFLDSAATISSVSATGALGGSLVDVHTASTQIPVGTPTVVASIGLAGGTLGFRAGSNLRLSKLLVKKSGATQTLP